MFRNLRSFGPAAFAAVALVFAAAPADAAKGQFSIGAHAGRGLYSMSAFNDSLQAADLEKMKGNWEFGGSVRYQVSEKAALDLEATMLEPESTTEDPGNPDLVYTAPALAVPLSLVYTLSEGAKSRVNLVVGAGVLTGAKLRGEQGPTEVETESETPFFGQAGFEVDYFLSPQFALTGRALGRLAGEAEVVFGGVEYPLSYTGATFGVGVRAYFGGAE